jgi:hypothetical protein
MNDGALEQVTSMAYLSHFPKGCMCSIFSLNHLLLPSCPQPRMKMASPMASSLLRSSKAELTEHI